MNVTAAPLHDVLVNGVMLTDGVTCGVIVTVMPLLVAVGVLTQVMVLVITTVTISLLFKVEVMNVLPVPATFTPFTFHW